MPRGRATVWTNKKLEKPAATTSDDESEGEHHETPQTNKRAAKDCAAPARAPPKKRRYIPEEEEEATQEEPAPEPESQKKVGMKRLIANSAFCPDGSGSEDDEEPPRIPLSQPRAKVLVVDEDADTDIEDNADESVKVKKCCITIAEMKTWKCFQI
jgi:hypothetical protein